MPQRSDPAPEPTKFVFDENKVLAKLTEVKEYYKKFAGKRGYNPYFFLYNILAPIEAAIAKGDKSQELYNKVMSLEMKEPEAPGCSPIVVVKK